MFGFIPTLQKVQHAQRKHVTPPTHTTTSKVNSRTVPPQTLPTAGLCVYLGKLRREDQEAPNLKGGGQWVTNEPISMSWLNTWLAGTTDTHLCSLGD